MCGLGEKVLEESLQHHTQDLLLTTFLQHVQQLTLRCSYSFCCCTKTHTKTWSQSKGFMWTKYTNDTVSFLMIFTHTMFSWIYSWVRLMREGRWDKHPSRLVIKQLNKPSKNRQLQQQTLRQQKITNEEIQWRATVYEITQSCCYFLIPKRFELHTGLYLI